MINLIVSAFVLRDPQNKQSGMNISHCLVQSQFRITQSKNKPGLILYLDPPKVVDQTKMILQYFQTYSQITCINSFSTRNTVDCHI